MKKKRRFILETEDFFFVFFQRNICKQLIFVFFARRLQKCETNRELTKNLDVSRLNKPKCSKINLIQVLFQGFPQISFPKKKTKNGKKLLLF